MGVPTGPCFIGTCTYSLDRPQGGQCWAGVQGEDSHSHRRSLGRDACCCHGPCLGLWATGRASGHSLSLEEPDSSHRQVEQNCQRDQLLETKTVLPQMNTAGKRQNGDSNLGLFGSRQEPLPIGIPGLTSRVLHAFPTFLLR